MIRFYLDPVISVDLGGRLVTGPKYFTWRFCPPALFTNDLERRDYGLEPLMLIAADMSDADDALLVSQGDVTKFADNLDQQLGADLAAMQAALEALKLPASMLTAQTTHRQVVRGIMGIFMVAQCMQGKGYDIFAGTITLATTVSQIPVAPRTALSDCMVTLGYDISGITGSTTVRQVLVGIANAASPSTMLGVTV